MLTFRAKSINPYYCRPRNSNLTHQIPHFLMLSYNSPLKSFKYSQLYNRTADSR